VICCSWDRLHRVPDRPVRTGQVRRLSEGDVRHGRLLLHFVVHRRERGESGVLGKWVRARLFSNALLRCSRGCCVRPRSWSLCRKKKKREAQLGLGNATRRELYSERWQSTRNLLWIQEYSRIAAIFAIPVVSRKSNSFAIRIFFRWDIPVISPITVLKLAMIVFTSLYFRTSWPNWFKFFSVSSKQFGLRPKTTKAAIRILTLPLLKTAAAEPLQSNATFDRDRRLYHDRARIDIALKRQKKKHSTAQIRITAHFSQAR